MTNKRCLSLLILSLASLCGSRNLQQVFADETRPPLKPQRSPFDMKELRHFVSMDLSRPYSKGPIAGTGRDERQIHGQLIDHNGQPVVGAHVVFVEPIGFSNDLYDENFDKTDEHGRFVVVGSADRTRLVFRRGKTDVWSHTVKGDSYETVRWPRPATCTIVVEQGLVPENSTVTLISTRYWAGMSVLRRSVALDETHRGTIENLLPGEYAITAPKALKNADGSELDSTNVELAAFAIKEGENRVVACESKGQRTVRGTFPSNGKLQMTLYVDRQKTRYADWSRVVDIVACAKDGSFETRPLQPGRYVLRFSARVSAPIRRGGRLGRGGRPALVMRTIAKHRIVVGEKDEPLTVDMSPKKDTRSAVYTILDSEGTGRWSHTDVQVSRLQAHTDREGVILTLLDILKDTNRPHRWLKPTTRVLGALTDDPRILDALLTTLEETDRWETQNDIISALRYAKKNVSQLVPVVAEYRHSASYNLRWGAYYALGQFADADVSQKETVVRFLIEALSDSSERIRSDCAATLGRLSDDAALDALRAAREDKSGRVRVWSAWAIWKITGERDQAIRLMTVRLRSEGVDGKWEAAYLLADLGDLPKIAVDALVASTRYDGKNYDLNRVKRTAVATLKKVAPETLKAKNE